MDVLLEKPTEQLLAELDCARWPLWNCGVSRFPWHYDEEETCHFLAGRVKVHAKSGSYELTPGVLVTFAKGLDCEWEVLAPVRKHYTFNAGRIDTPDKTVKTAVR